VIQIARQAWDRRSGASADMPQFGYGGVTIRQLTRTVFSASWSAGITFSGAPYPSAFERVFNFDLRDGSRIALSDLFQPLPEGLRVLADLATQKLRATQEEPIRPAEPTEQALEHFTFGPSGLDITFDRGAIVAGADGQPRITIPYSALDAPTSGRIFRYGSS
jgi:hypothetical protein